MYLCKDKDNKPVHIPLGFLAGIIAIMRISCVIMISLIYVLINSSIRIFIEIPFLKGRRAISKYVVRGACMLGLFVTGISVKKIGAPAEKPGFVVSNHTSWLDILMLQLYQNPMYISKYEIKHWPVVNIMTWLVGTVFIERDRTKAREHNTVLEEYFKNKVTMIFFPEGGTFSFGMQPFKSSIFEVLFTSQHIDTLYVQPVALIYLPPAGVNQHIYKWGKNHDTNMLASLLLMAGQLKRAKGIIVYGEPLKTTDYPNRKALAKAAENVVRENIQRFSV